MAERKDFLVEIGTEELPPKALKTLINAFAGSLQQQLGELALDYTALHSYATPRRLAVRIDGLATAQPDKNVERRGPPVKIAYDAAGNPTKAAEKFAEGCGIKVSDITTLKTDKGEWLYFAGLETGRPTAELLPGCVTQALSALPIPKRMRWGDLDVEFVRPVHWAVMLWGTDVIATELIGMATGNTSYGHRFHAPQAITLNQPAEYPEKLREEGWVIAAVEERKSLVAELVAAAARSCGGEVVSDDALLEEVAALVEWPVPVAGQFDRRFLKLPPEVLISTLKDHQRYFPVVTNAAKPDSILPWFVTISNIKSLEPQEVKKGNERVVAPRLADAEFFWESDKKKTLADRIADLDAVVFQKKLGSLADKVARVSDGAAVIAANIGGDAEQARRAAAIAKCDLLTGMVGEFPDLQGTMGRYYALHDGESTEVATAMEEQYLPRFAGDVLPRTRTGQALSIADKMDSIVSIFGLGQRPTGTKDPFGLRRQALGVLRIIIEARLELGLPQLIATAADNVMPKLTDHAKAGKYFTSNDAQQIARDMGAAGDDSASQEAVFRAMLEAEVGAYIMERLRGYLVDDKSLGIDAGMFDAVLATAPEQPLDFLQRIQAVKAFMQLPEASSLAAANKRIANIMRSAKDTIPSAPDAALLREPAEKELFAKLNEVASRILPLLAQREYTECLRILASLRAPIDDFFDGVMVMDDDAALRGNRLALLAGLRQMFLHTADFSKIQ